MDVELEQVKKYDLRPIREIVYTEVRKAIFDGRMKKGDHLVENKIAEMMNVSRTPVREALRQLEAEGLVANIPRKGAVVKGITEEDATEIYDLREVLEGLTLRLACRNITDDDISSLKHVLKLMEEKIESKDYDEYLKIHKTFNNIILKSANNKRLQSIMTKIYEYLSSLRNISLIKVERRFLALEEHKEIVCSLENKDEEKAEKLAREHVKKAKKAFFNNLNTQNS